MIKINKKKKIIIVCVIFVLFGIGLFFSSSWNRAMLGGVFFQPMIVEKTSFNEEEINLICNEFGINLPNDAYISKFRITHARDTVYYLQICNVDLDTFGTTNLINYYEHQTEYSAFTDDGTMVPCKSYINSNNDVYRRCDVYNYKGQNIADISYNGYDEVFNKILRGW